MTVPETARVAHDPWAINSEPVATRWSPAICWAVAAVVIGVLGPVARLIRVGGTGHAVAIPLLIGLGVLLEAAMRLQSSDRRWLLLAAAAAIATSLSTTSSVGRAPGIVTVVGVLVADAVLVEWRPLSVWRPRPRRVATLAVPLLVAAEATWVSTGSNATTAGLMVATLVVVEVHHRAPRAVESVTRLVERGTAAVGKALGALGLFIVVLPTLYLGGAFVRAGRWTIRPFLRTAGSHWKVRAISVADERRDAPRPYASTAQSVRRRRNLNGVAVIALVVAGTVIAVDRRHAAPQTANGPTTSRPPASGQPNEFDQIDKLPYSSRPGYADMPFADALQAELLAFQLVGDPETLWRNGDYAGNYLHVVHGERTTLAPTCACPKVTVWLLGASATFGIGQRDDHTVGSELVRLAQQDGIALEVRNLGVVGWTIWQEARSFSQHLDHGEAPPDLAVFLDGFNDALGTITQSTSRGRIDQGPTVMNNDDVLDFTNRHLSASSLGGGAVLGRESARRYLVQQHDIDQRAAAAHVATAYFLQPDAFTSPRQEAAIAGIYRFDPDMFRRAEAPATLDAQEAALGDKVHDIRHLFDSDQRPIFGDVVHTNERGAQLVAEALYRSLGPALHASAASR